MSLEDFPKGLELDLRYALREIDQKVMNSPEAERLLVRKPRSKRPMMDAMSLPQGPMSDYEVEHRVFIVDGEVRDRLEPALLDRWRLAVRAGVEGPQVEAKWAERPVNEPPRKASYKAAMSTRGRGNR